MFIQFFQRPHVRRDRFFFTRNPKMKLLSGLLSELVDALSAELDSAEARKTIRKRIMNPVMSMMMWEMLPWAVAAWAVATLGSVFATLLALRLMLEPKK